MISRLVALSALAAAMALPAAAAPKIEKSVKLAPGGLYELVFNPADGDVYVAAVGPRGSTEPKVVRVDGKTLAIAGDHAVAPALYGLGLNSRTQVLYGTATREGSVSVIDLKTGKRLADIKDGDKATHLREVIVDEQRNKAYAIIVGGDPGKPDAKPNEVWVIDGATHKLERKIAVPTGTLTGAALDVAGNRLFVTGMGAGEVVALDLATDKVIGRWPTDSKLPTNVAYDATGQKLFVASQGSGDLTVLDARSGAKLATVKTGEGALSVAVNPKVGHAYVANRRAGTVTVVDTKTHAVLADLETGTYPQTIAIDPATSRVFVTNKAKGLPRDAAPGTPPPEDPAGDTLTVIAP